MSTVAVMNPEDFPKVPLVINGISSRFIRENRVIPLELRNNVLKVLMADPADRGIVDALSTALSADVVVFTGDGKMIDDFLDAVALENDIRRTGWLGTMPRESYVQELVRRVGLKPDDPQYLDTQAAAEMERQYDRQKEIDLANQQVRSAFAGDTLPLTESIHGRAFMETIGPEGLKLIDGNNRIADPDGVATAVLRTGLLPADLKGTLIASLHSTSAADRATAARVTGAVSASPRLRSELWDSADKVGRAMNDAAPRRCC